MSQPEQVEKDTLYFDGNCPLCSAEISKLAKHSEGNLELQNIHDIEKFEAIPEKQELMARLHVRTANGHWLTGLDANIRAWHHTPYAKYWRILDWPVVRVFSRLAYEAWLRYRRFTGRN